MTPGETAQIITSIGVVTSALVSLAGVFVSWRNGRKIEEVRHNTNSLKDELVREVRAASLAKGHADGVEDEKAKAS